MGKPMIRVLISDDHAIDRGGFRQLVADEPDMCVAAEASTGDETIGLVREQAFDVVLLDIAMPDKSGVDTLRVIKQMRPEQGVLILSGYPESQYAINLLRAGANGYLNKECEPDEIIRAIRAVARGHRYLSEAIADTLASQLDKPSAGQPHEALSEREFQIFCRLATGQIPTADCCPRTWLLTSSTRTTRSLRARRWYPERACSPRHARAFVRLGRGFGLGWRGPHPYGWWSTQHWFRTATGIARTIEEAK